MLIRQNSASGTAWTPLAVVKIVLRHAHVVAHALDELADTGAGRLNPAHVRRQLGQVLAVGEVEIEENIGRGQQLAPAGLLLRVRAIGVAVWSAG